MKGVTSMITEVEILARLVLSAVIGGMIGFEREVKSRPAGLKTHILVSLGSTLIMLLSLYGFESGDPSRMAAQVVTGIGFLGAGTIMKTGDSIQGLTTAATIWISSAIGLAVGNGYYLGSLVTSFIVLITLVGLSRIDNKIVQKNSTVIEIKGLRRAGFIGDIGSFLGSYNLTIIDIKIVPQKEYVDQNGQENPFIEVHITIKPRHKINLEYIFEGLYDIQGVSSVVYKEKKLASID